MPAYAAAIPRPPRTLTELELATLLKVTGEHRDGFLTRVPRAVYERSHRDPNIDQTGPGFCVPCEDLPVLPKPR